MNAEDFLRAFPEVRTNVSTGGNCTAWDVPLNVPAGERAPLGGTSEYVLITYHLGEPCQPSIVDRKALFGVYVDGEGVEPRLMTWAQAALWLRGILDWNDVRRTFAP